MVRYKITLFLFFTISSHILATVEHRYIGKEITAIIPVKSSYIVYHSDTLILNDILLLREVDYLYDRKLQQFILLGYQNSESDTLQVRYKPLPLWLNQYYGYRLPEIEQQVSTVVPYDFDNKNSESSPSSHLDIHGSKSFRVSSQSAATSNFGQSLDLTLSGNLTPALSIRGTVSDRGYDPSYGTANSRLNELDKLHLELESERFYAEIGDILLRDKFQSPEEKSKKVSGIHMALSYDHASIEVSAARPKGIFTTAVITAVDGRQGPYQVSANNQVEPIVPGSETVWLDGRKLERGGNNDYLIDYPVGQITFTVKHIIDSRSRIEVDYELQTTSYKKEYLQAGTSFALKDSLIQFQFGWLREGDDKDENLSTLFSDADKDFLETVDGTGGPIYRDGVKEDSAGAYQLIVDSLPDSVFLFVGEPNGDYSVTFSYVGESKGSYRYNGNNIYQFAGFGNGAYLPVRTLVSPRRTDYFMSGISLEHDYLGTLNIDMQQSRFNRNLFSSSTENTSDGSYFELGYLNRSDKNRHGVEIHAHHAEEKFQKRRRFIKSDAAYRFMLPENRSFTSTEQYFEAVVDFSPMKAMTVTPVIELLNYKNSFSSFRSGLKISSQLSHRLKTVNSYHHLASSIDTAGKPQGEADLFLNNLSYALSGAVNISTDFNYSKRVQNYSAMPKGTAYSQSKIQIGSRKNYLTYEYYNEDTLDVDWRKNIERHRFGINSERQFKRFSFQTTSQFQLIKKNDINEKVFLNRLGMNYNNPMKNLTVGTSYSLSKETRNSRGLTYLEVETGEGGYIFEDSQYIADPNGNYIAVEEILSDQAKVSRSEKSFKMLKRFEVMSFQLNSRIEEELFDREKRSVTWLLPFYSDADKAYLYYQRDYNATIKVLPIKSGYFLNFQYSQNFQSRFITNSNRIKNDTEYQLSLRQTMDNYFFEEGVELFDNERDRYFAGSGEVSGYELYGKIIRSFSKNSLTAEFRYRKAEAFDTDKAQIYSTIIRMQIRLFKKGEVRTSSEYYISDRGENSSGYYLLTGNHPGSQGVIWSGSLRYAVQKDYRLNLTVSGRHSDDRTARLYARGELVAGF